MAALPSPLFGAEPRKRILVVDDDEPTARMLGHFLRGYDVDLAGNGLEGIEKAIAHRPDLILVDVWMPELDGIEMVRQLHQDPSLAQLPVIFVSAAGDAQHVAAAISVGARHFLAKPIDVKKLLGLVRKALGTP